VLLITETLVLVAVIAVAAWIYWEYRQRVNSESNASVAVANESSKEASAKPGHNGSSPGLHAGNPGTPGSSPNEPASGAIDAKAPGSVEPTSAAIAQSAKIESWETANLDKFAERLQKEADSKAVVIGFLYPMEKGGDELARLRAVNTKSYLTDVKHIAPARIQVLTGAGGGNADVVLHGKELYRVAASASVAPAVAKPFDESTVGKTPEASAGTEAANKPPAAVTVQIVTPAGAWKDPASGMMWSLQDNGGDLDWKEATDYCSNLRLGGYSGWILPSIDELGALYDTNSANGVRHIKGGIKLSECCAWSRSTQTPAAEKPFYFIFSDGRKAFDLAGIKYHKRALCVRSSAE
jgi:hypothetical protein